MIDQNYRRCKMTPIESAKTSWGASVFCISSTQAGGWHVWPWYYTLWPSYLFLCQNIPVKENFVCQEIVFEHTSANDKPAYSIQEQAFLQIMVKAGRYKHLAGSTVIPLAEITLFPTRNGKPSNSLASVCHTLKKWPGKRKQFVDFMQNVFDNGFVEPALPLNEQEYTQFFGVYHHYKPDQIRMVFDSIAHCHDLCSVSCIVSSCPVLFWKVTDLFPCVSGNLPFLPCQVSCLSLITLSVSSCSPWILMCI